MPVDLRDTFENMFFRSLKKRKAHHKKLLSEVLMKAPTATGFLKAPLLEASLGSSRLRRISTVGCNPWASEGERPRSGRVGQKVLLPREKNPVCGLINVFFSLIFFFNGAIFLY